MTIKVRFDGHEYEEGSKEHLDAIERVHKVEIDNLQAKAKADLDKATTESAAAVAEAVKRADAADGARDAAKAELDAAKVKHDEETKRMDAEREAASNSLRTALRSKVRLIGQIARFFASPDDENDDDGDEGDDKGDKKKKMDAKFDSLFDKEERDLMLDAIGKVNANFDATEKSDDYVRARYDAVLENVKKSRGVHGAVAALKNLQNLDAQEQEDPIAKAKAKRDENARNAWKSSSEK